MLEPTIRAATEGDLPALAALDLTYETDRALVTERRGDGAEIDLSMRWAAIERRTLTYATYTEHWLRDVLGRADAFLVAEADGAIAGLLIVVKPRWTDAAEITDLAIGRTARRSGAGRALVAAAALAQERGWRALWVEPRADNAGAIEFYLSLGFRLSGYNDRMYGNDDDRPGRTTLYMYLDVEG
jgi:ribosomal protein S18 acetylase RimI-like enzyme